MWRGTMHRITCKHELTRATANGTHRKWWVLVPRGTTLVGGNVDQYVPLTTSRCELKRLKDEF